VGSDGGWEVSYYFDFSEGGRAHGEKS